MGLNPSDISPFPVFRLDEQRDWGKPHGMRTYAQDAWRDSRARAGPRPTQHHLLLMLCTFTLRAASLELQKAFCASEWWQRAHWTGLLGLLPDLGPEVEPEKRVGRSAVGAQSSSQGARGTQCPAVRFGYAQGLRCKAQAPGPPLPTHCPPLPWQRLLQDQGRCSLSPTPTHPLVPDTSTKKG